MGLFRGLLIFVIGVFFIQITQKFKKQIENVPLIGSSLKSGMELYKDYMLLLVLALSQVLF